MTEKATLEAFKLGYRHVYPTTYLASLQTKPHTNR